VFGDVMKMLQILSRILLASNGIERTGERVQTELPAPMVTLDPRFLTFIRQSK
jgi:hypothetical protein